MKISWGYKIMFVYLAFVAGILFLVYKANRENFDLVTENYYDAELQYQHVIDQESRAAHLSEPPKVLHTVNSVHIELPREFTGKAVKGEVYLYRPSDASKDLRIPFSTADGNTKLGLQKNLSGLYDLKLSWQCNNQSYYHEQKIFF